MTLFYSFNLNRNTQSWNCFSFCDFRRNSKYVLGIRGVLNLLCNESVVYVVNSTVRRTVGVWSSVCMLYCKVLKWICKRTSVWHTVITNMKYHVFSVYTLHFECVCAAFTHPCKIWFKSLLTMVVWIYGKKLRSESFHSRHTVLMEI